LSGTSAREPWLFLSPQLHTVQNMEMSKCLKR
jgi:hypothetical protein